MSGAQAPSSRMAAKTMISIAAEKGMRLTNLKLQKLLYFAHGLMLVRHGESLVRENFQAWKYGPVLESLYHELKVFGPSDIPRDSIFIARWEEIPLTNTHALSSIKDVLDELGNSSGSRLIEISHDKAGPWYAVYKGSDLNIDIDNTRIRDYFRSITKPQVDAN